MSIVFLTNTGPKLKKKQNMSFRFLQAINETDSMECTLTSKSCLRKHAHPVCFVMTGQKKEWLTATPALTCFSQGHLSKPKLTLGTSGKKFK